MKLQMVYKDIRAEPDGEARNNSHNTRLHQNIFFIVKNFCEDTSAEYFFSLSNENAKNNSSQRLQCPVAEASIQEEVSNTNRGSHD